MQLLNTYGTLENIYAALGEIKEATQKKLEAGKQDAEHSHYLASIVLDVPIEANLEDCKLTGFDTSILAPLLEKLEFKTFLGKINELQQSFGGTKSGSPPPGLSGRRSTETEKYIFTGEF